MKNVKWIATAALLFLGYGVSVAQETKTQKEPREQKNKQDRQEREDKIDKLKIAYITTELSLTTAEAEKFWPIYNEQEAKLKELRKAGRASGKEMKENMDAMTDAEAKKQMETMFDNQAKETAIRKEYSEKFTTLLGAKRALKLMHAEHEFRRELLERLKDQHGPPHDGPHGKGQRDDK